jgi:hypothetical protein
MLLSFYFFLFFEETAYADEGSRPVGRPAAQLAASGLTGAEHHGGAFPFTK